MNAQPLDPDRLLAAFNLRFGARYGTVSCRPLQQVYAGPRFELLVSSDQKTLLALQTAHSHAHLRDLFAAVDQAAAALPSLRALRLVFAHLTDRGELDVFELSPFAPARDGA